MPDYSDMNDNYFIQSPRLSKFYMKTSHNSFCQWLSFNLVLSLNLTSSIAFPYIPDLCIAVVN